MSETKNILIVVPNYTGCIEPNYNYMPSLGIGYIVSSLLKSGFNLDVINMNHIHGLSGDILSKSLDEKEYSIVASGGNSLIFSELETIINVANNHKSDPVTILGGPIITSETKIIYDAIAPDYGVLGEGEGTSVELVTKILNNLDNEVAGTVYSKDGKIKIAQERPPVSDLDSIAFPALDRLGYEEYLDNLPSNLGYFTTHFDHPRVFSMVGNRGCPFQCTFCFHYSKYRERSLDNIFQELKSVVLKYKINVVILNDDCFSLKMDRVEEFCSRINNLRNSIDWDLQWSCQLTVKGINHNLLKTLKDAGCNSISFGFESFSQEVLKSMKKPITPDEIDKAFRLTQEAGMIVQGNFIFGDLAESFDTAVRTLSYWEKRCDGQIQLSMIQLYPGSTIYEYSKKNGIISNPLKFIIEKIGGEVAVNFSKKLTASQYKQLDEYVRYARQRYMHPVYPRILSQDAENRFTLKIKCPLCKKSHIVKNFYLQNSLRFYSDQRCRHCLKRFLMVGKLTWIKLVIKICCFSLFNWSPLRMKLLFNKDFK